MDGNSKRRSTAENVGPAVRATWSVGQRTTAWDRLWRMILSDLGPLTAAGPHERSETEGDDA